jgi:hypothetical protein
MAKRQVRQPAKDDADQDGEEIAKPFPHGRQTSRVRAEKPEYRNWPIPHCSG